MLTWANLVLGVEAGVGLSSTAILRGDWCSPSSLIGAWCVDVGVDERQVLDCAVRGRGFRKNSNLDRGDCVGVEFKLHNQVGGYYRLSVRSFWTNSGFWPSVGVTD